MPLLFPKVTVVLVNWNALEDTLHCLNSLSDVEYNHLSVVVVDNNSRDTTEPDVIERKYPEVHVIRKQENLGFTGGNNVGINYALKSGADYIFCLNTDTRVSPDFLHKMIPVMEADQSIGISGPAVYFMSEPERLAALGCGIDFDQLPSVRHLRDYSPEQLVNGPIKVDFVEGCALMIRRAAAEQLRGFDDAFFAYVEDADLCLRARAYGWSCVAIPSARIWHRQEDVAEEGYEKTAVYYSFRNSWLLLRRYAPKEQKKRVLGDLHRRLREWRRLLILRSAFENDVTYSSPEIKRLIQISTLVTISALGLQGPRWRYKTLENLISMMIKLACRLMLVFGSIFFHVNALRHSLPHRLRRPRRGN